MKTLLIPAFILLTSCVSSGDGKVEGEMCTLSKGIDFLEASFEFSSDSPAIPRLEINGEEADFCFPDQPRKYCLYEITSQFRKMKFKVASFSFTADPEIKLFDDQALRIERTNEEVSSRAASAEFCESSLTYSVTIKE